MTLFVSEKRTFQNQLAVDCPRKSQGEFIEVY